MAPDPVRGGEKIVVGMSGGVDSSVSALLLKRQGYDVIGLFMKNWEDDDDGEYCSTRQDLVDCASVADVIGIDLEVVNFAAEYRERVFAAFLAEYSAGRTPNPDVLCNAEIKFRAFLDHAMKLGAQRIATGHYAKLRQAGTGTGASRFELLKAADRAKDQSYFLHRLDQSQLSRVLFPLGELKKAEVRRIAQEAHLPNFARKDSTGICFIGERPFREFLNRYLRREPGPMRSPEGRVVGEHIGLAFYTIGQRKGIGLGGMKGGQGEAWYVAGKDVQRNELLVVQGHEHPLLLRHSLEADDLSWVAGEAPPTDAPYAAKTRYRQEDAACRLSITDARGEPPLAVRASAVTTQPGSGTAPSSGRAACAQHGERVLRVAFDRPQWAVTPGQSVVIYEGEVCLGGGVIR